MELLDRIVKECIEQHEGGEKFFDSLDESVRNSKEIFEELYSIAFEKLCDNQYLFAKKIIVVSGRFGTIFAKEVNNFSNFLIVSVEGCLRFNEFSGFGKYQSMFANSKVVFIDDSFYLGRTRDKIKEEVERIGGHFLGTIVAYDGSISRIVKEDVQSLYRYHPLSE
jgi:hypothetical protein